MERVIHSPEAHIPIACVTAESGVIYLRFKKSRESGVTQDKFLTITIEKETEEEARSYFSRVGAEFTALFSKLGSKLEEVSETDKLRLFFDFFHKGRVQSVDRN